MVLVGGDSRDCNLLGVPTLSSKDVFDVLARSLSNEVRWRPTLLATF